MSDPPFYAPNRATASRRHTRPGEHLWEFGNDHSTWSCERRDDGEARVEAQILCEGELVSSRRFETLALAVQWAEEERKAIEKGGA